MLEHMSLLLVTQALFLSLCNERPGCLSRYSGTSSMANLTTLSLNMEQHKILTAALKVCAHHHLFCYNHKKPHLHMIGAEAHRLCDLFDMCE